MAREHSNIHFLGHQSPEQLPDLYRNALALVYPSANFQTGISQSSVASGLGAPLVIMEAFSHKTPVIASNLGRIPALMEQTGGGLVYSTEQQLLGIIDRLLGDRAYRDDLGVRGYEFYRRNWTADVYMDRYFALIESIAATKRAGSA
jgi:glycosyltransferase involved in cell wall biosynthesis